MSWTREDLPDAGLMFDVYFEAMDTDGVGAMGAVLDAVATWLDEHQPKPESHEQRTNRTDGPDVANRAEPAGELVSAAVTTRHPEHYRLVNEADGSEWRLTRDGSWTRLETADRLHAETKREGRAEGWVEAVYHLEPTIGSATRRQAMADNPYREADQ
ncbi:hypothetical protein M3C36_08695 [Dietzia cinnamea]|uniref:hypothetical protein n=1 Tax=Dietzia TaxID=37914 RepID=UPI00101AD9E0|nr:MULTISPECIES: hypothetical protein [Dietzia]MCT1885262.1 hypothetical protein [Dietzia cinnamea]